jgi:hypothetical protein
MTLPQPVQARFPPPAPQDGDPLLAQRAMCDS